jgi:hypothetical protein
VKTVLTAMRTHFLTMFKMPQWAISGVDKFRRSFLWKGSDLELVKGTHCLMNWKTCLRPKNLAGLGINDIEKFGRALRLRWLWFGWDSHPRQWKHLLTIQDPIDRALFFSSTFIQIGDDQNTPFWEAKWVNAATPKDIAPNLFKQGLLVIKIKFSGDGLQMASIQ